MYTDWPGIYSYAQLNGRLFTNPGCNDYINDTPSPGGYFSSAYLEWQQQGLCMAQFLANGPCRITMTLEATLMRFEACLARKQQGWSILPARLNLSQWILSMKKCFGMCELVEEEGFLPKKDT